MSRFTDWYAKKGKVQLSEKRKRRYREDQQYREGVKTAARLHKQGRKDKQPPEYSVPFAEAAKRLEISTATLRVWRRRGLYPSPLRYDRRHYFTEHQMKLLQSIAEHLKQNRNHLAEEQTRFDLEIKVQLVHLNWG